MKILISMFPNFKNKQTRQLHLTIEQQKKSKQQFRNQINPQRTKVPDELKKFPISPGFIQ